MKKHMEMRVFFAILFVGLCGILLYGVYTLSEEDGIHSNIRSEIVTEKVKELVNEKLESTNEGMELSERIKYQIILHSPYGSDWNSIIRKITHFSLYFILACGVYVTLMILGVHKTMRFILTVGVCFCFAFADEYHQQFTGRTSSMSDVYLDTFGALVATCIWTVISCMGSCISFVVRKINAYYD